MKEFLKWVLAGSGSIINLYPGRLDIAEVDMSFLEPEEKDSQAWLMEDYQKICADFNQALLGLEKQVENEGRRKELRSY